MHRKIVETIKYVLTNSSMGKDYDFYQRPNTTDGFCSLFVMFKNPYHAEHIKAVSEAIGNLNGEMLNIKRHGKTAMLID